MRKYKLLDCFTQVKFILCKSNSLDKSNERNPTPETPLIYVQHFANKINNSIYTHYHNNMRIFYANTQVRVTPASSRALQLTAPHAHNTKDLV